MGTEETVPREGVSDENTKRARPPQESPNDRRKKKQHSFMSMEYEDELEAEVQQMGLLIELLDDTTEDATLTLNKKTQPPNTVPS